MTERQGNMFAAFDQARLTTPAPSEPRAAKEDQPRLKGHNKIILRELEKGPRTNVQLIQASGTMNFSARLSNVRYWLRENRNLDVSKTCIGDGVFEYRIVSLVR